MVNGEDNPYFKRGKGLRQGDPISTLSFNLVGDVLSRMLDKAARAGLVKGLLHDFREGGILSLQYADSTILFSSSDTSHLTNLKQILLWYEQISGMRINFHKSEVTPMNLDDELIHAVSHIFSCPIGKFPIKYLGIPLHYDKLAREDIQPLVDKLLKRIAGWRGILLSQAARAMLIKTCMASISIYILSFLKFPKWAIKLLNTQMANCLWNECEGNSRYDLSN
jgi:hypothetical protein